MHSKALRTFHQLISYPHQDAHYMRMSTQAQLALTREVRGKDFTWGVFYFRCTEAAALDSSRHIARIKSNGNAPAFARALLDDSISFSMRGSARNPLAILENCKKIY